MEGVIKVAGCVGLALGIVTGLLALFIFFTGYEFFSDVVLLNQQEEQAISRVEAKNPTRTDGGVPIIATPSIPLYNDFGDGVVDTSGKWVIPPYGRTLTYELSESEGELHFFSPNTDMNGGWLNLDVGFQAAIREIHVLITLEIKSDFALGLTMRAGSTRYDFMVDTDGGTNLHDGETGLYNGMYAGECCPTTHLLSFVADGDNWTFSLDGVPAKSFSVLSYPSLGGVILVGLPGQTVRASVSDVWVAFLE